MPDLRRAHERRRGMVLERDAVEDVLASRQAFDQRLGREVGFRQSVDEHRAANGLEAVAGRGLDQHTGGPICARPHHTGVGGHIAGLQAVRDRGSAGRTAQIGLVNGAGGEQRGRRSRCCEKAPSRQWGAIANQDSH